MTERKNDGGMVAHRKQADRRGEYEAPRNVRDPLKVRAVGRVADEPRAVLLALTERPTDDEIRRLHEFLAGHDFSEAGRLSLRNKEHG